MSSAPAQNIVFIVHYFPPINSTGGKRVEALSKYFARDGRSVTVITTAKTSGDGVFSEKAPHGVRVLEIDALGRATASVEHAPAAPGTKPPSRRARRLIQRWFGQLPDPRLPFALSFGSPFLSREVVAALKNADVIVSSMPPWPTHLAALIARWRFGKPVVIDYRDNFSRNHIMPGSSLAKFAEEKIDGFLARHATGVVVISEPMAEYYRRFSPRVKVVLNGYDDEIFDEVRARRRGGAEREESARVIRYLGRVSRDRIPRALIAALADSIRSGRLAPGQLQFEFYGDAAALQEYLDGQPEQVRSVFRFLPAVPYREALDLMLGAHGLLFVETSDNSSLSAKGVLTTKLFEYVAAERPIIAEIDPETEAGRLLRRAGSHHVIGKAKEDFAVFLSDMRREPVEPVEPGGDPSFVRTLSRKWQAKDYLAYLDTQICTAAIR